ncbi:long-chain-fatty-acid--CoA ligase 4-like [Oppia nitens]|uniref:long-chain-fatty-acid--CoA ligase 4-like n=1 Tax=Oppia nitens TaxID=1686743 RepID=UPI0023D99E76|nr:long-chain-fatty-acid--CoA ligase 4-like [Oppia nitens]
MTAKQVIDVIILVFLVLIVIYNVIPLVIYFLKKCFSGWTIQRAKQLEPKLLTSPWIRTTKSKRKISLIDKCSTVSQLFDKTTVVYKDKHSFGCRQVLQVDEEKQEDGRIFKKLVLDDYKWFTCQEISEKVDFTSKGFLAIGIKPKDVVMIFADTRLEWMIASQSLFKIGSTVATLYATLGEDGIIYGINEAKVTHLVTSFDLLYKLKGLHNKLKDLKVIIYMNTNKESKIEELFTKEEQQKISFYSLNQIEEMGKSNQQLKGEDPRAEDTAILMYTSGSTGVPKGVEISHKNLLSAIKAFNTLSDALTDSDVYCAVLPMAHILEMSAQLFFISNGLSVGYASVNTLTDRSPGLKRGIKGDLTLLKPTIMTSVPLILDRMRKIIEEIVTKNIFKRVFFNFFYYQRHFWSGYDINTPIISFIFCRKFKAILGGKVRIIACGGAPLTQQTQLFVRNCFHVILLQGYGLTETSASATLMDLDDLSVGFVGPPLEGIQIKLIDWEEGSYRVTDKPNPRGEVLIGGETVTKGYYNNKKLTDESFKHDNGVNWFITGDIGEIYPNGSLKIIDRKKDIIKLATGEYVSLAKIECALKKCPIVDNICIYGDSGQDFLIALIVPNKVELKSLATKLTKSQLKFNDLCDDLDVNNEVLKRFQQMGKMAKLLKIEIPNKVKICAEEWLPENNLVTTALKLRRKNIQQFYQKDINKMYSMNTKN